MPTKNSTTVSTKNPTNDNKPTRCSVCGKLITRVGTIDNGHGARCALVTKVTKGGLIHAHKLIDSRIVDNSNYIKVAQLHKIIVARKGAVGGLSINKMVTCLGRDRCINTSGMFNAALHAVITPIYCKPTGARYIHKWCATITGMRSIATKNFDKVSKAANAQATAAIAQAKAAK